MYTHPLGRVSIIYFFNLYSQELRPIVWKHYNDARNVAILLCHWILHAYGIIAITELQQPVVHVPLLLLVPFPFLFYIITVKFTHPYKLEQC